ncbi:MAG: UbiA family prenyltransferase, partial [Clostridia bacterium]|nr:UbiA family prenyltransferase [Clostridia bacterium]
MGNIKDYIRIARIDHWIKQLFIFPGMVFAFFLVDGISVKERLIEIILAFVATSFIASANYVINEWLDAKFDKFHPTKKSRPVVSGNVKLAGVIIEYAVFTVIGLLAAWFVS